MPKNIQKKRIPIFSAVLSMADLCPEPVDFKIIKALRYDKGIIVVEFSLNSDNKKTDYQVELLQKNGFSLHCLVQDPYKSWLKMWEIYATGKHNEHSVVAYKLDTDLNQENLPCVLPENLIRAISAAIRYGINGSTEQLTGYVSKIANA